MIKKKIDLDNLKKKKNWTNKFICLVLVILIIITKILTIILMKGN